MNQVTLLGNLGSSWSNTDKEGAILQTANGNMIVKNSIAITKGYKNEKGEVEHYTTWIPLVCFSKLSETLMNYTHKGDKILISGELMVSNYVKNNEARTSFSVKVLNFEFAQKKEKDENPAQAQTNKEINDEMTQQIITQSKKYDMEGSGEIPF